MAGFSKKVKRFFEYYNLASKSRSSWFNIKWRIFVVLLVAAFMLIIKDYLQARYMFYVVLDPATKVVATFQSGVAYAMMFYWFFVGIITGAFAAWLLFEGEYALGIYHTAVKMEHEIIGQIRRDTQYSPKRSKKPAAKARR